MPSATSRISRCWSTGLQAEREQGITIDVGYRFFSTARRRFIIADTPGHEQYTRNMATGASTADLAVILVDATKGLLRQTYRHSAIVALMGIQHVVLAVNKMDLVDYQEERFSEIVAAYATMAERLGLAAVTAIPLSALLGDNVIRASTTMPWYAGPTLLNHLETVTRPSARRPAFPPRRAMDQPRRHRLSRLCRHRAGRQYPAA